MLALSNNLTAPPPGVKISPKEWQGTVLEVRREIWTLWINFRTATDGTFRDQLQLLLDRRDLQQKEFASLIHQSSSVVNRWLKGRQVRIEEKRNHIPDDLSTVMMIVDELDCDLLEKHLLIRAYALEVLWLKGFRNE